MSKSPKLSNVQVSQILKAQVTHSSSHPKLKSPKAQVIQSSSHPKLKSTKVQVAQIAKSASCKQVKNSLMAKNIYDPATAKNISSPPTTKKKTSLIQFDPICAQISRSRSLPKSKLPEFQKVQVAF